MIQLPRRGLLAAPLLALTGTARAQDRPVRIGVLNDQGGVFSDSTGPGSTVAAEIAAEQAGKALGIRAQVIAADHQNKPDVGVAIAREWFDRGGVDAIVDLGNSAVALAVSTLAREKNKVCLVSAGGTTLLTGAQCSPNTVQWTYDTYAQTNALAQTLVERGQDTWFFITVDYTFGQSLQEETTRALARLGGKVAGAVRHPLNTTDFSSYLLQAQASGAKVIALANGGDDTGRCVKQAREFELTTKQTLAGLSMLITDVFAIGAEAAQGLLVTETFYWDLNDGTRAFSREWSAQRGGREPTMMQAGVYGAVLAYLKAVHALGGIGTGTDGAATVRQMKTMPSDDLAFGSGTVRADGRAIHDNYVFRVKEPARSRSLWDLYETLRTIPGTQAFRAMDAAACPLVVAK